MRKLLFLLPVILLLFNQRDNEILISNNNIAIAYADTDTVWAITPVSGYLENSDASNASARDSIEADGLTVGTIDLRVGTRKTAAGIYGYYRSYLAFPIPAGIASIDSICLFLYGRAVYNSVSHNDTTFNIYGASAYKSTLTKPDWKNFNGWIAGWNPYNGTKLAEGWNNSAYTSKWNKLPFVKAGLDSAKVASGDTLWIVLIKDSDYNATYNPVATDSVYYGFTLASTTSAPYLYISYALKEENIGANGQVYPCPNMRRGRRK